jgi:two-component system LytT family response regulator
MTRLRAVIVDDEPLALARIRRLLERDGRIDIVAACSNGLEAIDALHRHQPDVAFLDVQMPDADGFRVLAQAKAATRVVFITAHAEHAVRAFDAQATDYLLKPLSYPRLRTAIERLHAAQAPTSTEPTPPKYAARLVVQAGARLRVLDVAAIDCLLAQANYVEVEAGEQRHLIRDTLGALESRLDPDVFVRIHRSRIVRIDAIQDLELLDSGELLLRLKNGRRLSTGRSYRERLRAAIGMA